MDWTGFGVFIVSAAVVAAAPGPTVLQICSQAMSRDPLRPASLIAGSIFANILMVLATVLGIGALIVASQPAFNLLRWIGSGYLIYLGFHYWRMRAVPLSIPGGTAARPYRVLFFQAVLTSLTNPKGLVFYLAFLPLFVSPEGDPDVQLTMLGITYISLCLIVDIGYAIAGSALSGLLLTARAMRWKNKITGTALIGAGISLFRFERA